MASPETDLILIRHGESRAQVEGFFSGHDTCKGLSELGRRQAVALRHRLASTRELGDVDVVYTSILPRSIETAEIIGPARSSRSRSAIGARSTRARPRA